MNCRGCKSNRLDLILDLGEQPWCNDFLKKEELGKELADIVAYVALLANAANIDLEKAMIDKFDEVSIKLGSNYRA